MTSGSSALARISHTAIGIGTIFAAHHVLDSWYANGLMVVAIAYVAWTVGVSVAVTAATAAAALAATTIVDHGVSYGSVLVFAVSLPLFFIVAFAASTIEAATRPAGLNPARGGPSGSDGRERDGVRSVPS